MKTKYVCALGRFGRSLNASARTAIILAAAIICLLPSIAAAQANGAQLHGDFDGDGRTDIAVYRPSAGLWYILTSSTNFAGYAAYQWGVSTDVVAPGDYDGDGKTDPTVYRPSAGLWYILTSSTNFTGYAAYQWGVSTDVVAPGDYDGDGKTDPTVYRPSAGLWYILTSSTNFTSYATYQWGVSTDVAAPGDYDGDGKTDPTVYRRSAGLWYILTSSTNFTSYATYQWGVSTDVAAPGDYDGDGKTDPTVYRPSNGVWYVLKSSTNFTGYAAYQWGVSTDVAAPGDYDGDGKTDPTVFRPSNGLWYVLKSSTNFTSYATYHWGVSNDVPVSNLYRQPPLTPPPPPPPVTFGPGSYRIGALPALPAGRYFTDPVYGCYWERLSALGGIIANDFVGYDAGQQIVDIRSTDYAFSTDADCGTWYSTPRRGLQANITPGMWLVGSQVTPGTYVSYVSYGCYWERLRHFDGTLSAIIDNDFVNTAGYQSVQVSASDVGFQTNGDCGTWQRVSTATATATLDESVDSAEPSPSEIEENRTMRRLKVNRTMRRMKDNRTAQRRKDGLPE